MSSSSSTCSSSECEELSQEEVQYLTQYVSGFSVTKYDCAPDKCPECLAAYYDFVSACTTPSYTSEQSESETDETDSQDSESAQTELMTSELCPVTVKSAGKVEISVAKLFKRVKRNSVSSIRRNHRNKLRQRATCTAPNGVYVDLEDSDVSLSIEYPIDTRSNRSHNKHYYSSHHDNDDEDDDCNNSDNRYNNNINNNTSSSSSHHHHHDNHHVTTSSSNHAVPSFWDWFYYPLGTYGWLPYSLPYCLVPMYYLPYQLYSTIPKPIMVRRDTPCLNSQRLCYVPAQEIKNCKYQYYNRLAKIFVGTISSRLWATHNRILLIGLSFFNNEIPYLMIRLNPIVKHCKPLVS